MPESPLKDTGGIVECAIFCKGKSLASTSQIISADVEYRINSIPKATITIADGDMPTGKFELCEGDLLKPGEEIELKAGYSTDLNSVFKGVITRLGITVLKDGSSCTKIECRHKAIALTESRHNANYQNKSDDDIIGALASKYGISSSIGGGPHKELMQYYCTDWDFIMTRAEANACWLLADQDGISIEPISSKGNSELSLTWGTDIIEFNATVNSEHQVKNV